MMNVGTIKDIFQLNMFVLDMLKENIISIFI